MSVYTALVLTKDKVGLEKDVLEGFNSYKIALKSNSTACKKEPLRPSASFYNPGSGIDGRILKICFGFRAKKQKIQAPSIFNIESTDMMFDTIFCSCTQS